METTMQAFSGTSGVSPAQRGSDAGIGAVPVLEVESIAKAFGGVRALRNGQLTLKTGTVHALCGGNGAGKSTFLSILMGLITRDQGTIRLNGEDVQFNSPSEALKHGVAMITQELSPVPELTVAENIYLGREPRRFGYIVDFGKMVQDATGLLKRLQFDVPANAKMSEITLAQCQLVEIAKALSHEADVVIMDEPTSAIGEHEVHVLFDAVRKLKESGTAVVYVSHKLTEIFEIADEYTIFRDGAFVEAGRICDIDRHHLVRQILGHELNSSKLGESTAGIDVALAVEALSDGENFSDITLQVKTGEVLGIYGLVGSGRTEFVETIFGLRRARSGTVTLHGQPLPAGLPKESIRRGMAMVTEDRKLSGLVLCESVGHNISLSALRKVSPWGFIRARAESGIIGAMVNKLRVKCASPGIAVESLSGGNQQKVVFARCLTTNPKLLICDEPTRGIDEGSKQEIYAFLRDFVARGGSAIVVSSEAPEIPQVSDRVAIFRGGRLARILGTGEITQEAIVNLAS
ncbi:sugar ABC transporter ATP-binding protein [Paraburkholderia phenoliruptrix]|uniref:sugar ABC transporter ATP-binding protein n=1 Tax=Paraburkholderia phenoliruptrix TaxID=252970 RepID=UPI002869AB9F|nr:sugar ABC transporter ATP-binding protein [Paraburkholderia phenoliruptrix]WMY09585.1 sugar ABC transporter ATP-binding protein [Paraburkholderia phenoliruptrix]